VVGGGCLLYLYDFKKVEVWDFDWKGMMRVQEFW